MWYHTSLGAGKSSSSSKAFPEIPTDEGALLDEFCDFLRALGILEKAGFRIVRQGKHIVMSNGVRFLTIPRHNPINAFTMGGIVRDAGLTIEEFRELLSYLTPPNLHCTGRLTTPVSFMVRPQICGGEVLGS